MPTKLRRGLHLAAPLVVAGLVLLATTTTSAHAVHVPSDPVSGPCVPGATEVTCQFQYGDVKEYGGTDDGDTIKVTIDGQTTRSTVRLTGVNAMEHHTYGIDESGECHALDATHRVRSLIDSRTNDNPGRVRLAAQDATSMSGDRLRRSVAVEIDGVWTDIGEILLGEGLALPHANHVEYAWNNIYRDLAQRAAAQRVNLYDTDHCGAGPRQEMDTRLTMYVNWDAEGGDKGNLNGEWVRLRNRTATPLDLTGWWLRDSHTRPPQGHGFEFPAGATIPARGTITVHSGGGVNTAQHLYFGETGPVFDNVKAREGVGDGAYLFDPDGDLRVWQMYQCDYGCSDPLSGKITVSAFPTGDEVVTVQNISTSNVNLDGHLIVSQPYSYPFTRRAIIKPGETLRLFVTKTGKETRLTKRWNKQQEILPTAGDSVSVRTFDNQITDCHAYGDAVC